MDTQIKTMRRCHKLVMMTICCRRDAVALSVEASESIARICMIHSACAIVAVRDTVILTGRASTPAMLGMVVMTMVGMHQC